MNQPARGKVVAHLKSLQDDVRSLRGQVAGSTEIFDKICWNFLAEFQATVAKRFRVISLDSEAPHEPHAPRVIADPAELLDRVYRAETVSVSDCVAVIHSVLRENSYMREQFSATRFKEIVLERKLRSAAEDCKIKSCANQRSREQLATLEAISADLRKQLAEKNEEVHRLRAQVEALDQKQVVSTLQTSSSFDRLRNDDGDITPRPDFASPMFQDIHQPKNPLDFGKLDNAGPDGGHDDRRSPNEVVQRIYKKHSEWSSKWELKSVEQRRAEEHSLCRTASDRFEVQSSHHVALPCEVLPFTVVSPSSPKHGSLSSPSLPAIHVSSGAISGDGPPVSGLICPQRPSVSRGPSSPRGSLSPLSPVDRSPSPGSMKRTNSQDSLARLSPKLEPNAMVVAPPPIFDVSTRKWTSGKR